MQHVAKNVKTEQPLLNKRANREIDKPCDAGGGGGWAAEESKEIEEQKIENNTTNILIRNDARKSKKPGWLKSETKGR